MTPQEKIHELANDYELINDELINKLVKIVEEERLVNAIQYYFTDHEFDEDTYLLAKITPYAKMRVAKFKVERFLKKKNQKDS
jgi:hypothetical protein